MNQYGNQVGLPSQVGVKPSAALTAGFLSQAFTWMFAGLLLTAGVSYLVQTSPRLYQAANDLVLLAIIAELGIAFGIQLAIRRINALVALALFFVFAAINGLTIGLIVSLYTTASVAVAFISAAGMFGAAAIYGVVTKRSLASMGGYLTIGLIGLIVAMVVNLFLASSAITFIISLIGVALFTALTAYDTQKIARGDYAAMAGSMEKGAVFSALLLYIDFINLFLFLLRLTGSRR